MSLVMTTTSTFRATKLSVQGSVLCFVCTMNCTYINDTLPATLLSEYPALDALSTTKVRQKSSRFYWLDQLYGHSIFIQFKRPYFYAVRLDPQFTSGTETFGNRNGSIRVSWKMRRGYYALDISIYVINCYKK